MIDYTKQAKAIFDIIVFSRCMDTDTTLLKVEERLRKIGHVEHLRGQHDQIVIERKRHDALKAQINEMKSKMAQPRSEA